MLRISFFIFFSIACASDLFQNYLDSFDFINYPIPQEEMDLLESHSDKIYQFLKDNPEFQESALNNHFTKLANSIFLTKQIHKCNQSTNPRQLGPRILQAAATINPDDVKCHQSFSASNFSNFLKILDEENPSKRKKIHKKLLYRSFDKFLQSYIKYDRLFSNLDMEFIKANPDIVLKNITDKVCRGRDCTQTQKNILKKMFQKSLKNIPEKAVSYDKEKLLEQLNNLTSLFNQKLKEVENHITLDQSWIDMGFWDRHTPSYSNQADENYQEYFQSFMNAYQEGPGVLFISGNNQEKGSALRLKEDDLHKKRNLFSPEIKFEYDPYPEWTEESLDESIENLWNGIQEHGQSLLDSYQEYKSEIDTDLQFIQHMLLSDPTTIGQHLVNFPKNTKIICEAIKGIENSDWYKGAWRNTVFFGGTAIAAGLTFTGIGATVGGVVFHGAVAASTLSTVATISSVGGWSVAAAQAGYYGRELYVAKNELSKIEKTLFSGHGDASTLEDLKITAGEYKANKLNMAVSFGLGPVEMGRLLFSGSTISSGATHQDGRRIGLQNVNNTLSGIFHNGDHVAALKHYKETAGRDKLTLLLGLLSQEDQKNREDFLKELNLWKNKKSLFPSKNVIFLEKLKKSNLTID